MFVRTLPLAVFTHLPFHRAKNTSWSTFSNLAFGGKCARTNRQTYEQNNDTREDRDACKFYLTRAEAGGTGEIEISTADGSSVSSLRTCVENMYKSYIFLEEGIFKYSFVVFGGKLYKLIFRCFKVILFLKKNYFGMIEPRYRHHRLI